MVAGFYAPVSPIVGEPSPRGLLGGCIPVIDDPNVHVFNGTEAVQMSCADSNVWYQCDARPGSPTPDNPASKTFDRPQTCPYEPVSVYSGFECSTLGLSYEEGRERALEQLRLGEQAALERYFMEQVLCSYAAGNDLTPAAGALHIAQGIGALESWLATNYGGRGVLHIPAGAAALVSMNTLVCCGDECPTTLMGNSVVLGAGYAANVGPADPGPGCAVAPSGEAWIYITPAMQVRRTTRDIVQQSEGQTVNIRTNDRRVLAETAFVPEVACCIAAAVRVSLTACP